MVTVEIPLTQGKVAIVDETDVLLLEGYRWIAVAGKYTHYARAWNNRVSPRQLIWMHCLILGVKGVDHRDGNGLNNTRNNLRQCTTQHNACNKKKRRDGRSQYKGVRFMPHLQRPWIARIGANGGRYLGCFPTETEAATAYDQAARELFGEFAKLNFPQQT